MHSNAFPGASMLDTFKLLIENQYLAALRTLHECIVRCPDELWDVPVANHPVCRVAFHTLFFADLYLCENDTAYKDQQFHRDRPELFGDYEELQEREPASLYSRNDVAAYLHHCRRRVAEVVDAETAETLTGRCAFARREFTRAELHVYNIRHIQHHAAQLSLRLRLDAGADVPWIGSGW